MQNKTVCDLHTHSSYSDGSCTPAEIISKAEETGLAAVALTDHNTLAGLPEFITAAKDKDIDAVAGVEITADFDGHEVHIVGLFIKEEYYGALNEFLEDIRLAKGKENFKLYKKLVAAGYEISFDNILAAGKKGSVNRVHFAKELIRCGYVSTVKEAFDGLLSEKHGLYVPTKHTDSLDVVELLSSLSAVPILAHPFLSLDERDLRRFLRPAKEKGLLGLETNYSTFSAEQTEKAIALSEEFRLLRSGGSDFHGENKPLISLGVGRGNLAVPYSYYEKLKNTVI